MILRSCDTMILIGYCIRETESLGPRVMSFLEQYHADAFSVAAAHQEFNSALFGIGDPGRIGIHERLITHLARISQQLDEREGDPVESIIDASGLDATEKGHAMMLADHLLAGAGPERSRGEALRQGLFEWEQLVAQRRSEMRRTFPRWSPHDRDEARRMEQELLQEWRGSGGSWEGDCKIIAQTHCRACLEDVILVSEDRGHIGRRRDPLLTMTRIQDIVDLEGAPLSR